MMNKKEYWELLFQRAEEGGEWSRLVRLVTLDMQRNQLDCDQFVNTQDGAPEFDGLSPYIEIKVGKE